jgi:hypothetical protein
MPRLPDRFDLWVRRARACDDPERQLDYILGGLMALPAWYFLNVGSRTTPEPARAEIDGGHFLLVFSDAARVLDLLGDAHHAGETPVFSLPPADALAACLGEGSLRCDGLLVNPGEDAAAIPRDQLAHFERAWRERGGATRPGFWIPNLTTEEEDFWQQHGL